ATSLLSLNEDRVGVPQSNLQVLTLLCYTVTNTEDFHLDGEALGDTNDCVVDEGTRQTMQCTVFAVVIWTDNANFVVLNDSGDRSRDLNVEGSLRALDLNGWPLMVVSTPFAKAMGALPIRDIVHTSLLPDVG